MKILKITLIITFAISLFAPSAHGQWGTGYYMGAECPYPFAPADSVYGETEAGFCATCTAPSSTQQMMSAIGAIAQVASVLYMRNKARRAPRMLPYRAPLPGYYNPGPDYGTVPGSIGAGAFGCEDYGMVSAPSPWGNPYLSPFKNAHPYAPVTAPAPSYIPVTNWADYQGNQNSGYNYGFGYGSKPIAPEVLPYPAYTLPKANSKSKYKLRP